MFINSVEEALLIICSLSGALLGLGGGGSRARMTRSCPQGASCLPDPESAVTVIRSNLGGGKQNDFESLKEGKIPLTRLEGSC